ncbi:MAG: DUF362 domain-containing protein [Anaerolineales bacterium]|jgi:uncharacterized protein (DUF362 family)
MCARDRNSQTSRREFLKLLSTLGGAAALTSFLQACTQESTGLITPAPTLAPPTRIPAETATGTSTPEEESKAEPSPTATQPASANQNAGTTQVAFIKTQNRTLGVRQAVEMFGLKDIYDQRVFIKPNYNSSDPTPGSTHPDVLRTIITILQENKSGQITVGDRSGMEDTRQTMQRLGVFEMQEEFGFKTIIFDDLSPADWVMINPPRSHWAAGFPFARPILETDTLIQTCCLKTHQFGGQFTLSLKNSVGMVAKYNPAGEHNFMDELHSSPHQRRMIAEINTAYTPDLVVLDGVECFIDGGPANGRSVSSEVILAGTDRVALDAVGVALLRYHGCRTEVARGKIFQQEQIKRAVQLGLGVDKADKIEILTGDAESAAYAARIQEVLLA